MSKMPTRKPLEKQVPNLGGRGCCLIQDEQKNAGGGNGIEVLKEKLQLFRKKVEEDNKVSIDDVSVEDITDQNGKVICRIYRYRLDPQKNFTVVYFPATAFLYSSRDKSGPYFPFTEAVARMMALYLRCPVAVIYTDLGFDGKTFGMQVAEAIKNLNLLFESKADLPKNVFLCGYCSGATLALQALYEMLTKKMLTVAITFLGLCMESPCLWSPDSEVPATEDSSLLEDPSTPKRFMETLRDFLLKEPLIRSFLAASSVGQDSGIDTFQKLMAILPTVFFTIIKKNIPIYVTSGQMDIFHGVLETCVDIVVFLKDNWLYYDPANCDHGSNWFDYEYLCYTCEFCLSYYAVFLYDGEHPMKVAPLLGGDKEKDKTLSQRSCSIPGTPSLCSEPREFQNP